MGGLGRSGMVGVVWFMYLRGFFFCEVFMEVRRKRFGVVEI